MYLFLVNRVLANSELEILIEMLRENGTVSESHYKQLKEEINAGSIKEVEEEQQQNQTDQEKKPE